MDGYKYLSQISRLKRKIVALEIRRRTFEELADSIPTHPIDEPRVQKDNTKAQVPFVKWIDKIWDVEKAIEEAEAELKEITNHSLAAIGRIDNADYQNILILRFMNEMRWEDIASELNISYSTCKRWYNFALTEFEKLNGDERL